MDDYRHRKELFVSNLNGTTLSETGSILLNGCATYFLCQLVKVNIAKSSFLNLLLENSIIVIPPLFVCTLLSSFNYLFLIVLWSLCFLIYFTQKASPIKLIQTNNKSYSSTIELFRGQILIATCLCILAVDFPIFPRRYAKTENYGYSLMDKGVGLFALAHGIVSAEARNKQTSLKDLFLENFILFLLGLIRLISIKYFSYVEHVSEYGLDIFLLANVLTGIVNLNINTIDSSDFTSFMIILLYMFTVSSFTYFCPSIIKLILKYLKLSKK
ncbi:unnamed protein product [Rotaria socialis]|uniref:Uncharacterized protein n=1 Tax=Rotaria socialis TaxID=392032 RepID=A0A821FRS2_9BILA|nr:unnamed protein product [Rotaria socialis]